MTAYNSLEDQTDSTPFITATNTRTRPGVVAVSRDLLSGLIPYGSKLLVIEVPHNPTSCGGWHVDYPLSVEDTMHPRKTQQVDLWLEEYQDAVRWGVCPDVLVQVYYPSN